MNDNQAGSSPATLDELWRMRNAAAMTVSLAEDHVHRAVLGARVEDLVALIETFSPARAIGPEWARTFEPLVERLWAWRDDATMAALADVFRARGPAWIAVVNALVPEHGAALRHPAWAKLPAFATV